MTGASGDAEDARAPARRDLGLALLLLALTVVLALEHAGGGERLHRDYGRDPGPALLPELLITVLGLGAGALMVAALIRLARADTGPLLPSPAVLAEMIFPAVCFAGLTLYIVLLPHVGFVAGTFVFAAAGCAVLALREGVPASAGRVTLWLAQASLVTGLVWYVFGVLLRVPLS